MENEKLTINKEEYYRRVFNDISDLIDRCELECTSVNGVKAAGVIYVEDGQVYILSNDEFFSGDRMKHENGFTKQYKYSSFAEAIMKTDYSGYFQCEVENLDDVMIHYNNKWFTCSEILNMKFPNGYDINDSSEESSKGILLLLI